MRSVITLALGRFEVDWGTVNFQQDHGELFQPGDQKRIPRWELQEFGDGIEASQQEGVGKPFREVRDRLELLGFTMLAAERDYNIAFHQQGFDYPPIPFIELRNALVKADVNDVQGLYAYDHGPGEFGGEEILKRLGLDHERAAYGEEGFRFHRTDVGLALENFGAWNVLRILAENEANLSLEVTWSFRDFIDGAYAPEDEFTLGALSHRKFLIVTEGSSDAKILRKAFHLYRPCIADFFRFVDMEEGYPFSGSGNMHRFAQGLISIGMQNRAVFVYDNDAEGVARMRATQALALPGNMRTIRLPDVPQLLRFKTRGAQGESMEDINGRAASVECYLDLAFGNTSGPVVEWTSINRESGVYQGELVDKGRYMKEFLKLAGAHADYGSQGIEAVLDRLVTECVTIAQGSIPQQPRASE